MPVVLRVITSYSIHYTKLYELEADKSLEYALKTKSACSAGAARGGTGTPGRAPGPRRSARRARPAPGAAPEG